MSPIQRALALMCLVCGFTNSMRKRAATSWLDNMPSRVLAESTSSSSWDGPQCYWNNVTWQCLAFSWARPQDAPKSRCTPTTLNFANGNSMGFGRGLHEEVCKHTTGRNDHVCTYDKYGECRDTGCSTEIDKATCENLTLPCKWHTSTDSEGKVPGYCTRKYCREYNSEDACTKDDDNIGACEWSYGSCSQLSCSFRNTYDQQRNSTACAAADDLLATAYLEHYSGHRARCVWLAERGGCHHFSHGCMSYSGSSDCAEDPGEFGNCAWDGQSCLEVRSCDDYETAATCAADGAGIAEATYPGAKCNWKPMVFLMVGHVIDISLFHKVRTSGVLAINSSTHQLRPANESSNNDFYTIQYEFGLGPMWKRGARPVEKVRNQNGVVQAWTDVPTPIPDKWLLEFSMCEDGLPERKQNDPAVAMACNHHMDVATCNAATQLFPCPSYCGRFTCWMSTCAERCSACE